MNEIKPGDTVELRCSGSREMVAEYLDPSESPLAWVCSWHDDGGVPQCQRYIPAALVVVVYEDEPSDES